MSEKINGKFSKKFLIESLKFSEDEAKYIMDIQKKFPEIMDKDVDEKGFVVDGEKLCKELGVKSNFNDWLLRKTKGKEGSLIRTGMIENTDFKSEWICQNAQFSQEEIKEMSPQKRSAYRIKNKIIMTIECAKIIAMDAPKQGIELRKYFILMEKAIRGRIDWVKIRHPEKEGYKKMCNSINRFYVEKTGKEPNKFKYSTEADMLNMALFGLKSKQIKDILELTQNDLNRDYFELEINKAIANIQFLNTSLIDSKIEFNTRKKLVENTCDKTYSDLRMKFHFEYADEIDKIKFMERKSKK